ncbi:VOC family protein [Bacillus nakamurai]|uniref:VOC family protein n=1 Tax=Bacillus nakamurai TaxID=1793963 RepID=UPI0020C20D81|nr:VOC family protein [Bacillus nakamurai]MCP6682770.1 VOC family protein [Bacillus nakamurai]
MQVERLDHLVLTVASIERTVQFYSRVLGMKAVTFGAGRTALLFGDQKINLHEVNKEFEPKAQAPTPGSADLCFITKTAIPDVIRHVTESGLTIEEGPVKRTGAIGDILSVYLRDPDGNLIEISAY